MKSDKVGLYGRVSTTDKGQDPELQLKDLRAYANARGWKVFGEYVDEIAEVMGVSHTLVNKTLMNLPLKSTVNSMAV